MYRAHTVCSLGIKVKMEINVTVLYQIKKEIPMLRLIKLRRVDTTITRSTICLEIGNFLLEKFCRVLIVELHFCICQPGISSTENIARFNLVRRLHKKQGTIWNVA
ncbi:hypothetical protein L3X38_040080 [Prunus dulcis]|uniref:Uncharacterized protein n=1 Tax=Prunus dulcis TaxID=3755 RepID=A0AAD4VAJ1_PRUDU|nr:hypothetical protein L3X38_040080 [Prunus dulcis]